MKIDEIIIKLCSERGYDPSQVNDYPTLLEQFECIKELLKTYPNQQYYTVKAYTYIASTMKFSFKISDVNNYGRQINIGDILIVTLANNILEIAQISSLDVEAGNGIADDVGQLTGSKGDTGDKGEKGDTGAKGDTGLPALTFSGIMNVQTIPQVGHDFSYAPAFASSFNRTPIVGDVLNVLVNYKSNSDSYMCTIKVTEYASPTLKGTYVNVTKATGGGSQPLYLAQGKILYGGGIMAYGPTIPWYKDTISADEYLLALPSQGVSIGGIYKFDGKLYVGKCLKFMITNNVYTSAEFTGCDIETGNEMHRGLSNSLIQIYDPKVIRLN